MGAPFPSSLTAAPAGGHVAWVQNAAGVRNIWVATAPDYARQGDHRIQRGRWAGNRVARMDG